MAITPVPDHSEDIIKHVFPVNLPKMKKDTAVTCRIKNKLERPTATLKHSSPNSPATLSSTFLAALFL